MTIAVIYTCSK